MLGGGLAGNPGFVARVRAEFQRFAPATELVATAAGAQATLLGAALLRALFPGAPAQLISAHADRPGSQRSEPPKLQVLGRIEDGPDWSLSWNWLTHFPEYREWVEIYGDRGAMQIDFPGPYSGGSAAPLTVTLCDGPGFSEQVLQPRGSAFALELEAFHAAITEGAPILSDAAGAGRDAALLRAMAAELGV